MSPTLIINWPKSCTIQLPITITESDQVRNNQGQPKTRTINGIGGYMSAVTCTYQLNTKTDRQAARKVESPSAGTATTAALNPPVEPEPVESSEPVELEPSDELVIVISCENRLTGP